MNVTAGNLANYDSAWSGEQYGARVKGLFPMEEDFLTRWFPAPRARVLDLGCGAGRTTVELGRRGYDVIGIDLSDGLLDRARRSYPHLEFRNMDATALAFEEGSFDAALFSYNGIDCIHPVAQRERCMREVHRVLRPGGVFLLSSHNALGALLSGGYFYLKGHANALRWIWQQRGNPVLREGYWRYEDPGGPQYLYSALPARTEAQLRRAGFEVVDVRGATGESDPGRITRHQQHVHFAARKP